MTDFTRTLPVKVLKVNGDISGDAASHFSNYSTEANRRLVMTSVQNSPFYQTHTGQRAGGNCQAFGEQLVPPAHRKLG